MRTERKETEQQRYDRQEREAQQDGHCACRSNPMFGGVSRYWYFIKNPRTRFDNKR
jgi:hypothetical protein